MNMKELMIELETALRNSFPKWVSINNNLNEEVGGFPAFEIAINPSKPYIVVAYSHSNEIHLYCQKLPTVEDLIKYIEYSNYTFTNKKQPNCEDYQIRMTLASTGKFGVYKIDGTEYLASSIKEVVKLALDQVSSAFNQLEKGM